MGISFISHRIMPHFPSPIDDEYINNSFQKRKIQENVLLDCFWFTPVTGCLPPSWVSASLRLCVKIFIPNDGKLSDEKLH